MHRFTTTIATLTATAALALPGAALAADASASKPAKPTCAQVADRIATNRHLSGSQESSVAKACATRNAAVAEARKEIKSARQAAKGKHDAATREKRRTAVAHARKEIRGARVTFRKAVRAIAKG